MRYAIVSDIHANLQAWKAVLLDIRSSRVDQVICLGDIVGYGPNPAEVLKSVHANIHHFVLGNHDAVVCGKLDASLFNEGARNIISWTRERLNSKAVEFLKSLPLSLDGGDFRCTHGDFSPPAAYNYVIDPPDALASWQAVNEQLLFIGHTHEPAIFLLGQSGIPHVVEPQDFVMEEGKRYLVNVGSVGQPRDGEIRSCYCILDTESRAVYWRRVPFDIDAFRAALHSAGVPSEPSSFLTHDPRLGKPPLREQLNFSPASTPDQGVQDADEVRDIEVLKRSVTKWKTVASVVACAAILAGGVGAWGWWDYRNRAIDIGTEPPLAVRAEDFAADQNIFTFPEVPVPAGSAVPGWKIRLGDKRKQSVRFAANADAGTAFTLSSETAKDEIAICSSTVTAQPGMKVCMEALFKKSTGFEGNIAAVIVLTKLAGESREVFDPFVAKVPNVPRKDGWLLAKRTTDPLPAHTESIQLQIRGNFTGELMVKDISLCRRD